MITASKITDLLLQPGAIQEYDSTAADKWAREYPFFSLFQYIRSLKQDDPGRLSTISRLYPGHPVLLRLLQQNSRRQYHYADISVPDAEQAAEQPDAFSNPVDEILLANQHTPDYFSASEVPDTLPENFTATHPTSEESSPTDEEEQKALMRVMSFTEWLSFLSHKNKKEKAEEESKRHLRAMWQKEKLAKAMEDDTEEIPETVFNMAVNSLSAPEDITNESMAEVYLRQHKYAKAIEIYQKLSLLYPEKSIYFASKVEKIKKEI